MTAEKKSGSSKCGIVRGDCGADHKTFSFTFWLVSGRVADLHILLSKFDPEDILTSIGGSDSLIRSSLAVFVHFSAPL